MSATSRFSTGRPSSASRSVVLSPKEAALADADGHRDALLDERQLLRLFEAYLDVVGDGRPADGLRVDRRGRGLGLLGGVAQPLDRPRVVDAVAQQQHRLALRSVVFQAVLDGRRQVGGGAVGACFKRFSGAAAAETSANVRTRTS